jgi:hypothetical protein
MHNLDLDYISHILIKLLPLTRQQADLIVRAQDDLHYKIQIEEEVKVPALPD